MLSIKVRPLWRPRRRPDAFQQMLLYIKRRREHALLHLENGLAANDGVR